MLNEDEHIVVVCDNDSLVEFYIAEVNQQNINLPSIKYMNSED